MQFTHFAGCGTLKQGSDSMKIDRARAQKAFADYAAHYNAADAKVKLKIDHTYRVSALCARIAQSLALPPEDVDLAWLSGILHDVGLFEQLRRYNTFIDAQSVSHAALSVAVLFDEGRIRDYLDDAGADALLRTAVEWHSAFRLPEALDDRTRLFCQILRDADKIDILRVNNAKFQLLSTTDNIDAIAERVGFDSVRSFYRVFQKLTGVTPGDYRAARTVPEGGNP